MAYYEDIISKHLGGLAEGGHLLLSYNQYSLGWRIGILHVMNRMKEGDFTLFLDFIVPISRFVDRIGSVGLNVEEEGKRGNLAIINAFDSNDLGYDFVYPVNLDPHTIASRIAKVKRVIAERYGLKNRRTIGVTATIDMIYRRWGADILENLIMRTLTVLERLQLKGYRCSTIMIVNRDAIPSNLHSWLVTLSDQVIITEGKIEDGCLKETIAIIKNNKPDFQPKTILKVVNPIRENF